MKSVQAIYNVAEYAWNLTQIYEDFWKIPLRKIGFLSDPYQLTIRGTRDRFLVREHQKDRAAIQEFYVNKMDRVLPDDTAFDYFFDVGAHIGVFSVYASPRAKHVLSFEPAPETYTLLLHNIQQNCADNITLFQKAAGNTSEPSQLYLHNRSTMHSTTTGSGNSTSVPTMRLSRVFRKRNLRKENNIFLKIDCEGAEEHILRDLNDEFLPFVNHILIECHDTGDTKENIETILIDNRFQLHYPDRRDLENLTLIHAVNRKGM